MLGIPLPTTKSVRRAVAAIAASVLIALVFDLQSVVLESGEEPSVESKGELPRRQETGDVSNLMQGAHIHVESLGMHDNVEAQSMLSIRAGANHAKGITTSDAPPMRSKTTATPVAVSFANIFCQDTVASKLPTLQEDPGQCSGVCIHSE